MCTGLAITSGDFYFGRNLDLNYEFGQKVVITPRNYKMKYQFVEDCESHFAMIGMATVVKDYPLYADAMNEKGLAMAGLNFNGFASFVKEQQKGKFNVAPYEIIPWILQNHSTVAEVKETLKNTVLIDSPFMQGMDNAPLHWIIADKDESIVLEQREDGVKVFDNPVGVLTNNPTFEYHLMSLRNYRAASIFNGKNTLTDKMELAPLGVGMGGIGLPGDSSPNSRFVKATFLASNSAWTDDDEENRALFFHILDNVAMVKGTVKNDENQDEYTVYSSCINGTKGEYIYKTHKHISPVTIKMFDEKLDGDKLIDKGYLG